MASGGSASGTTSKNDDSKWYFTAEQLANSPSRKYGMDADQELMYRQRAANLIQDMGQRLQVSQLCINTAIVYMHRFYAFHSFTQFHRNSIAAAALFLAAKVEEQPRKLEHIIKVVHICLGLDAPDPMRENYAEQAQDLVFNENVLLQTLGFDVAIDHPHTHVVKTCHLVKASKDLAQTSYFMASNSLHLTTMCLQYKPTVVACFCIHLACKWSRWEIPQSNEGRHWFHYVDKTVTLDLLKQLTDEFLHIFDRCPTRLKSKMKSIRADAGPEDSGRRTGGSSNSSSSIMAAPSSSAASRGTDEGSSGSSSASSHHRTKQSSGPEMIKSHSMSSSGAHQKISSSSSSGSRSRSDRPSAGQSQSSTGGLLGQQQQQPPQHYGSSSSSGNSNNNSKGPSSISSHRSNMQQPPSMSQSSSNSSSSQRTSSGYQGHDGSKSRQPSSSSNMLSSGGAPPGIGGNSSSSSSMHSGYNQMKADRHVGGQKIPVKSQSTSSSVSSGSVAPMYSVKHQQQQQQQASQQPSSLFSHPPSYNQSISGRSTNVSLPDQQSGSSASLSNAQIKTEPSSFRLLDESIGRLADPIQICTPPKQSKPSSIFSPDWKDSQNESLQSVSSSKSRSSGHYGNVMAGSTGSSATQGDRLLKPPKGSPSGKKQHLQQQQHHGSTNISGSQGGSRSDMQKKDRRMVEGSASIAGQLQQQPSGKHQSVVSDKKSLIPPGSSVAMPVSGNTTGNSCTGNNSSNNNSHNSHGLKRALDGTLVPPNMLTANDALTTGGLSGNGTTTMGGMNNTHSNNLGGNTMPTQGKRPHSSNEQIRQDDGTDFREQKVRRTEQASSSFLTGGSPSDTLFNSSFDLACTFDKMDDSSSLFNFNDPGSLLSQPLLSDSKPSTLAKSSGMFNNTINGIETNAALVSSLLKESLFNETPKFSSLYGGTGMNEVPSSGSRTDAADTKPMDTLMPVPPAVDTKPPLDSLLAQPLPPQVGSQAVGSAGAPSEFPQTSSAAPPSYPWSTANAPVTSISSASMPVATVAAQPNPGAVTEPIPLTLATGVSIASDPDTDQGTGGHRSKSEKKKKKEKHKHKEKDKTKDRDREEKKKHKKDKEKHRDREHREKVDHHLVGSSGSDATVVGSGGHQHGSDTQPGPPPGPIKIKLNRSIIPPVVESVVGTGSHGMAGTGSVGGGSSAVNDGLKIKIPKDRLSGSSSLPGGPSGAASGAIGGSHSGSSYPASVLTGVSSGSSGGSASLKLKISKDKTEHYNISATSDPIGSGHHLAGPAGITGVTAAASLSVGGVPITGIGTTGNSGSSGSKKKEKDRDKDREKNKSKPSSSSTDHGNRTNGSGTTTTGNSSSKSSNKALSNLLQQQQQQSQAQQQQYGLFMPGIHEYHHQAGFDYLQQQQTSLQQQQPQQYYSQFGQYGQQQAQQQQFQQQMPATGPGTMLMNTSVSGLGASMIGKLPGQPGTGMQSSSLPPYYYSGGPGATTGPNQGGNNVGKK
ncbi:cyclin-T [Anopheles nili]|uniref:cyclin-T n=1 Tax=Anopheles nili TaxID=185578 RepID=UPI00237B39CB|nr:cyclin-T [Anopheles nili]